MLVGIVKKVQWPCEVPVEYWEVYRSYCVQIDNTSFNETWQFKDTQSQVGMR